jgi:K+-dependent Na+/Ca+ exchanger-like protein
MARRKLSLGAPMPDLKPSEKTRRKLERQTVALSAVLGCCTLWALVSGTWGASSAPPAPASPEVPDRRLTTMCAVTMAEQEDQEKRVDDLSVFLMLPMDHLEMDYGDANDDQDDLIRLKDNSDRWWRIPLYVFIIVYMFLAIATVCDEFFVPALEAFVDEFGISMDVAGATFMAAGGSMPELLTSFISVFQEQPGVGFFTIMGSAVFNVLFVIAVCAIFNSTEALELTWWPLARDCSFYMVALCTVAFVFEGNTPNKIDFWEALLLLLEYIGYCFFMKFNAPIRCWVEAKLADGGKLSQVTDAEANPDGVGERRPSRNTIKTATTITLQKPQYFRQSIIKLLTQNAYLYETAGIAAVVRVKGDLEETWKKLDRDDKGWLGEDEIKSLLEEMLQETAPSGGDKKTPALDSSVMNTVIRRIARYGNGTQKEAGKIFFDDFKRWYIASETRIKVEVSRVFDAFDLNKNQKIELDELVSMLKDLGHKLNEDEGKKVLDEVLSYARHEKRKSIDNGEKSPAEAQKDAKQSTMSPAGTAQSWMTRISAKGPKAKDTSPEKDSSAENLDDHQGQREPEAEADSEHKVVNVEDPSEHEGDEEDPTSLSFEQFQAWYTNSLFYKAKMDTHEKEGEADEAFMTLDAPEDGTFRTMFMYCLTYPICAVLYITIPDCRHPRFQHNAKIAMVSFSLSLFWIAVFCNLLFECTVVLSNTIPIAPEIAGVTVIAAGTSIPDLLSSYIVAKNGEGDMAVSSSIGSNIFDVTVGLPLPWLCYSIAKWRPAEVNNEGLFFSLMLLIGMLAAVITTIKCMKWKMTKSLGYCMLLLYVCYLVVAIFSQTDSSGIFK